MFKQLVVLIVLSTGVLYSMNCAKFNTFKTFNDHWYTITHDKLSFGVAQENAEHNGGYLAIPNSEVENSFLAEIVTRDAAWIGIHDPNFVQNQCNVDDTPLCFTDDTRFRTVKGSALGYRNWNSDEPNNAIYNSDFLNGTPLVSPAGEYWTVIGAAGKWADVGNHINGNAETARFQALFEFENMPECATVSTDNNDLIGQVGAGGQAVCDTKIYNRELNITLPHQTFDCQADANGTQYCPFLLAECGQEWDYYPSEAVENNSSIEEWADILETVKKVTYEAKVIIVDGIADENKAHIRVNDRGAYFQFLFDFLGDNSLEVHWNQKDGFILARSLNTKIVKNPKVQNNGECFAFSVNPNGYTAAGQNQSTAYQDAKFCLNGKNLLWSGTEEVDWDGNREGVIRGRYISGLFVVRQNQGAIDGYRQLGIEEGTSYVSTPNATIRLGFDCYDGGELVDNQCTKEVTTYSCPAGYTMENGKCKKTINYTYYEYLCNSGGQVVDAGGDCGGTNLIDTNGDGVGDSCNSSIPQGKNCKKEKYTCKSDADRECVKVDNKMQCSPFPCFGSGDVEDLDTPVGIDDKNNDGWTESGNCAGQIYIFNGQDNRCRSKMAFGIVDDCCKHDAFLLSLIECRDYEQILDNKKENEQCHYVGEYCSDKVLGACVQKKKTYCCFNSKLARMIVEAGREQLSNIDWGVAKNPVCRGFTPEEFEKIDFSRIDLTEFSEDIQSQINTSDIANTTQRLKDKINNMQGVSQ